MAPKTDEEISQEIEEVEFEEVEIKDAGPEVSQDGYVMGHPVYQPVNTDLPPMPLQAPIFSQSAQPLNYPQQYIAEGMPCIEPAVNAVPTQNENLLIILPLAKRVRYMAIGECILIFQFLIGGFIFILILLPFPVLGFLAGRYLYRPLTVAFMVFLVLMVILRIAIMFLVNFIVFYIVTAIVILVEIIVLRYQVVFYRLLGTLKVDERRQLLEIQNGPTSRHP